MALGGNSSDEELKVKLYNAMESDKDLNSGKGLNKGKGIDRGSSEDNNKSFETKVDTNMSLDKYKDIDRAAYPEENKGKYLSRLILGPGSAVEPHLAH